MLIGKKILRNENDEQQNSDLQDIVKSVNPSNHRSSLDVVWGRQILIPPIDFGAVRS
jgi:hypothetical protein